MIKYKYNEKEYAKAIINQGFITKYYSYELKILAKYYRKEENKKAKERKELLYKFCEEHITNFNRVKYFKMINSALKYGSKKKNQLIIIKSVPVTIKEIEYVNKLDIDYNYKKVLFTFIMKNKLNKELCLQKFGKASDYNFFGGKREFYKEVYEMSKVSKKKDINTIINELSNFGYIDVRTRGRINLLFIDNIEESDDIIFNIEDFDDIGYYFDYYNGENNVIECANENCHRLIKKSSNKIKYCSSCAMEIQFNQKKEWDRTKRIRKIENP